MKLSIATMACLPRRTLQIAIDHGCLSKAEIAAIKALRASGGRSSEHIARRKLGQAINKQFVERDRDAWVEDTIGKYAYERATAALKEMTPMTTSIDLLQERVSKSRDVQKMLSDTIKAYQRAHGCSRQTAIDKVLYGPYTREIVDLERRIDAVAKLGINRNDGTLPQPRSTADIDFSNPLRGTRGYSPGDDDRRPGRAHATGGPQSGEEDQPVIEDANDVLERLTKAGMAAGKSRARAMSDAAMSPEFSAAHKKERARKYGV